MNLKKTIISIAVLLGISFGVYYKWLLPTIYTSSDWGYGFSDTIKQWLAFPSSIYELNSLGSVDILLWRYPINVLYGIFGQFGYDFNIASRFLVFWPTLVLGNIVLFFLGKKISKTNIGGIISAIVFNYQTYFFVSQTAFLLYAASVWMIISFTLFSTGLETTKNKQYILLLVSGLSLFISGSYDFRVAYMTCVLLGLYVLFSLYVKRATISFSFLVDFFRKVSLPFIIFILLNLYWVLPVLRGNALLENSILQRGLFGNEFMNIMYAITLFHPFWTGGQIAQFNPQPIFGYFWMIPLFAFIGLFLYRRNEKVIFFGLISFLGIFLTKQVDGPFGFIYTFLFQHVPGFSAFREATKFYMLLGLGYAILIGCLGSWVIQKIDKKISYIFILVIITIFLSNSYSFIIGGTGMNTPRHIPKDYIVLKNFLEKQKTFSRSLWIPAYSRWGFVNNNNPAIVGIDQISNFWLQDISTQTAVNLSASGSLIGDFFHSKKSQNILANSSVRFVILPLEDIQNSDDFFSFYGKPRSYYADVLNNVQYLKKISIGTNQIVVYENQLYKPKIYVTYKKETIDKDITYQKIQFSNTTPTSYTIHISHVLKPFYLNFTDSFNSNWKLKIGAINWLYAIVQKDYFLSVVHTASDAGLNSFYTDPKTICQSVSSCMKNSDGTYSFTLTLYFRPQAYLSFGLFVSSLTLLFITINVIWFILREVKKHDGEN